MEPVTHALTSIALGRAGLNKITRMATPMLVVSGMVADLDWLSRVLGPGTFLHFHRTATHSAVGTVAIAVLLATAFWMLGRKYRRLVVQVPMALMMCATGAGFHLAMDTLNDYGVKLLWPFSSKWYSWDLADSVDAWIILFLLCGLLLPELFRLVLEEIGSKPKKLGRQRGAIVSLIVVVMFIGGRAFAHQRAVALLDSREYRNEVPVQVAAFPRSMNPLIWSGAVETDDALVTIEVPIGPLAVFDPDLGEIFFKPEQSLTLKNAVSSSTAVDFLSYARFPLAHVEPRGAGYEVRLRDLRYASELSARRGIVAIIDLNSQSLVTGERLEFDESRNR